MKQSKHKFIDDREYLTVLFSSYSLPQPPIQYAYIPSVSSFNQYDLLVKLGFSHEIAYIMAQQKHNNELDEEATQYINKLKEEYV
jgi:hypothetical protein